MGISTNQQRIYFFAVSKIGNEYVMLTYMLSSWNGHPNWPTHLGGWKKNVQEVPDSARHVQPIEVSRDGWDPLETQSLEIHHW